ncbi:hypothetical protein [Pseudobutyrivibrio ruminis]|uniref:hypothetical protein n=1 Tax=Pseudobutyrivibrio ruminis TaxID=46206 RepID=UPI00041DF270|nr:hypothetical protein [Pseudobutyrivibrio ruminis]
MVCKECVILLTGTINTSSKVPFLSLSNADERRTQYIDAIRFYITKSKVKKIVFCENSGEECPPSIKQLAKNHRVDFEWITFNGNIKKTIEYGKSYGESEILDYAFETSYLLKTANYFIKITGRLLVKNINVLLAMIGADRNYFDAYGDRNVEIIDSRLFAMKVDVFRLFFQKQYITKINYQCNSIEQLYPSIIKESNISIVSLPIKIWFEGMSGGYGVPYSSTTREIIIKSIRKYINSYRGHRLVLDNTRNWQGDMQLTEEIWNRYFILFSGKRVAICGMGKIGRRIYSIARRKCKKLYLCDSDYKQIGKYGGHRVYSYAYVCNKNENIDYYLICVKDEKKCETIKKQLFQELKNSEKVHWIMDYIDECETIARFIN